LESLVAIKTGTLESYSEQQLVDCSTGDGNQGCNGGMMDMAYEYVIGNHGLCTEQNYTYVAHDQTCKNSCNVSTLSNINSCQYKMNLTNEEMKQVIFQQPIVVAIQADHMSFQFYKSGIYDDENCLSSELDHAVSVVGWGLENGTEYWIMRNSWSNEWGEDGYMRMATRNICGINSLLYIPTK